MEDSVRNHRGAHSLLAFLKEHEVIKNGLVTASQVVVVVVLTATMGRRQ